MEIYTTGFDLEISLTYFYSSITNTTYTQPISIILEQHITYLNTLINTAITFDLLYPYLSRKIN